MHTERFDFDTLPDRSGMGSAKWSRRTPEEKAAGIVPMTIADMEFRCAPCVVRAVLAAAEHGVYGYTDADNAYFDAVAGWMARRHGWAVERDWIVPVNGVVPALSVAVRAFSKPGDGVLLQTPGYAPFTMAIEANGRVPVYSPLVLGDDMLYHMDLEDLRRKAEDPRVKLLALCSPHNPVGRVWTPEELRAVGEICDENGVLVISDEIHFDLALYGEHAVFTQAAPFMRDKCAILTAASKAFNLAGLQLANTIIPGEKMRAQYRERMNADGYSNASYFGYHATIAAYSQGDAWLDALLSYVRDNFTFLGAWLKTNMPQVRLLPAQGTYLAWVDFRALRMSDEALAQLIRDEAMVYVNPGTMFGEGGEGFMRLNLALPRAVLSQALSRLLDAARKREIS